jgi:hypothetical protein
LFRCIGFARSELSCLGMLKLHLLFRFGTPFALCGGQLFRVF